MTKELCFVDTLVSVKYNKILKTLSGHFVCIKYTALDESLVTNIALGFASCYIATRLSSRAVYFIQTGGSALSNTYRLTNIVLTTTWIPGSTNLSLKVIPTSLLITVPPIHAELN